MESILTSIKKAIGIPEEYNHFDPDVIMHINTVFMVLKQLGVGPSEGFYIEDDTSTWAEFLENPTQLQMVKTYMALRVRLLFDPPANSSLTNSIDQAIKEFEFRLNIEVDPKDS